MTRISFGILASLALASAALPACGASVALENRPCPCASGWTCCAEQNVCVAPGTVCPAPGKRDAACDGIGGFGGGGSSEDVGGVCVDASTAPPNPHTLAMAQSARCMATDRVHLYWQNSNGLVVGVPKTGGSLQISSFQTPIANNPRCGLAIDEAGSTLYTTAYQYGKLLKLTLTSNGDWRIGGSGSLWGALSGPSSLALDDAWIYVTEYDGGTVTKLPKSGIGDAIVLASGLAHPVSVVVDDSYVYWLNRGTLSVDAGTDAAAASNDGALMRVSKAGGDATPLATRLANPEGLARNGRRLYWAEFAGGASAIDVDGKNQAVVAANESSLGAIAADGESVFWGGAFDIRKLPRDGRSPRSLYPKGGAANVVVVDDKRVYWADGDEIWTGLK